MSQQGVAFIIKTLDNNNRVNRSRDKTNTPVNNISSWSLSQPPDRVEEENTLVIPLQPDSCLLLKRGGEDRATVRPLLHDTVPQPMQDNATTVPLLDSRESSREEYTEVPVSLFGKAALLGMGWREGEGIGKSRKGLSAPIELIPHAAGLGLGAVSRGNRPGKHSKQGKEPLGPVVGADGRVKHHKGLDESVELASSTCLVKAGSYVRINEGAHEGLLGRIRELDSERSHVTVSLSLGDTSVCLPIKGVVLLDTATMQPLNPSQQQKPRARKELKKYGLILKGARGLTSPSDDNSVELSASASLAEPSRGRDSKKTVFRSKTQLVPSRRAWIRSDLKVRLISKSYRKGRFYNSKVSILDVVSPGVCMCRTDQGQLLEGVREEMLETLLPKDLSLPVMVISGQHIGQIGLIQEKNPSKCIAAVLMEDLDAILYLSYDDICQVNGVT